MMKKDEIVFWNYISCTISAILKANFLSYLLLTSLIAIGRRATVGQPRYWSQSAVSQIMTSIPLNFSDKEPKIITFKVQILSLFFAILCHFEFYFALLWHTSLFANEISWSWTDVISTLAQLLIFCCKVLVKKCNFNNWLNLK